MGAEEMEKSIDNAIKEISEEAAEERLTDEELAAKEAQKVRDVAKDTMKGDLRDTVLDLLKYRKKSWQEMSEAEQRDVVDTTEKAITYAIDQAVNIIASSGRRVIIAKLDKVVIKDGIKGELSMSKKDDNRFDLFESQGKEVLLVVTSGDEFHGVGSEAEIDVDQRPLPLDEQPQEDGAEIEGK